MRLCLCKWYYSPLLNCGIQMVNMSFWNFWPINVRKRTCKQWKLKSYTHNLKKLYHACCNYGNPTTMKSWKLTSIDLTPWNEQPWNYICVNVTPSNDFVDCKFHGIMSPWNSTLATILKKHGNVTAKSETCNQEKRYL